MNARCAYWVDLGITSYKDTLTLQKHIADLRKKNNVLDVILATEHHPEVNFGVSGEHNLFSEKLLVKVKAEKGDHYNHQDIVDYLSRVGVQFSISDRGGGAAVFSPGQFVYYPVVNYKEITGKPLDVGGYKKRIYKIMFQTLLALGIEGIEVTTDQAYATRNERKDIWINRDGKALKMGSKGVRLEGDVAYYGFSLYIQQKGLEHCWLVKTCGYSPNEVSLISVEKELGREISHAVVHQHVKKNIKKEFEYEQLIEITKGELEALIRHKM